MAAIRIQLSFDVLNSAFSDAFKLTNGAVGEVGIDRYIEQCDPFGLGRDLKP